LPIVDRESVQSQLQRVADQLALMRNQLAGSPNADPEALRQLGQLVGQLNQLSRQLATAPAVGGRADNWRPPPPPPGPRPVDEATLSSLVEQINAEGFSENKVRVLSQATQGSFFLCAQAQRLLPLLAFRQGQAARARADRASPARSAERFQLLEPFPFSESKAKAQRILSR